MARNRNWFTKLMNWFALWVRRGISVTSTPPRKRRRKKYTKKPEIQTSSLYMAMYEDEYEVLEYQERYFPKEDKVKGHVLLMSEDTLLRLNIESISIETHRHANMAVVGEIKVTK